MNDVWVALLRAVNLGEKRVLPSASLRELLSACGATHVRTYIQSGNAVFRMGEGIDALAAALDAQIQAAHGFPVETVLRGPDELRAARDRWAFPEVDVANRGLVFFDITPEPAQVAALRQRQDRFALVGRDLHLGMANGFGRSDLPNFDKLGGVGTMRNWRTLNKLIDLCDVVGAE